MTIEHPSSDDRLMFDLWLSVHWLPSVMAAVDLRIFETLAEQPATMQELSRRLELNPRGVEILLPMVASLGLLDVRHGKFQLTDTARSYLLSESRFFWGGVYSRMRDVVPQYDVLINVLKSGRLAKGATDEVEPGEAVEGWASGEIPLQLARGIATFMESTSAAPALGVAKNGDFRGVTRLLDVGAGSGCFSVALAHRHPHLRCTLMDLPTMCEVALERVAAEGLQDRVDARSVDMFREPWPSGYQAIFLSNIFHDWALDTCAELAASAFAALPSGGRIYLHEILLDDNGVGPRTATAFSMQMLLGTRGRQYSFVELAKLLRGAGFEQADVTHTYGYHSLIRARKP